MKNRTRQEEMLQSILEILDPQIVMDHILGWLSSDDACDVLEDIATNWEIDLGDEEERELK